MNGVPVGKIAVANLIFAIATLIAAVTLSLFGHNDQANLCFGALFGGAGSALITTSIAVRSNGGDTHEH